MEDEGFPDIDGGEDFVVPGAMYEVPGPNPFPTGSRFETSTEPYAAGAPPIDTNSWTVQEAKRRRAEQFGDGSAVTE